MSKPVVALALPMRGGQIIDPEAYARGAAAKATLGGCDISPGMCSTSLLPFTFNTLWAGFLNARAKDGLTHFAMMHDDIRPDRGWLDVLIGEMEKYDADVVSAVVPIKDGLGLTSTAIDNGEVWGPRRLTLTEVFDRDETFTDPKILLNTGLWVCRFRADWCENIWFRQADRMEKGDDGLFYPLTAPEDWNFSRDLRALKPDAKLYATRKVGLDHERAQWHNRRAWGAWKTDETNGTTTWGTKTLGPSALTAGD